MSDIKEFAKKLSGREYEYAQFTPEELKEAKENGYLIIYGASDDLMEIEGAITDEADVFDGGTVHIKCEFDDAGKVIGGGVVENYGQENVFTVIAKWYEGRDKNGKVIEWTYETTVPHETFEIMHEGNIYCRGIVVRPAGERRIREGAKKMKKLLEICPTCNKVRTNADINYCTKCGTELRGKELEKKEIDICQECWNKYCEKSKYTGFKEGVSAGRQ